MENKFDIFIVCAVVIIAFFYMFFSYKLEDSKNKVKLKQIELQLALYK